MPFIVLKNVKKPLLVIFLFLLCFQINAQEREAPLYIKYLKDITNPFIEKYIKNYELNCIGGGGALSRNVEEINLKFIAYRKGTIEEARVLEVTMIEDLLSQINNHEKIRPFLNNYPFHVKDIIISVAFRKDDDSRRSDGSVVYVSHINNTLFYDREDPKTGQLVEIMKEPYEEALNVVNGKSSKAIGGVSK